MTDTTTSPNRHFVTAPSGLAGYVRPLRVKEANLLTETDPKKRVENMGTVLRAAWLETTNPGPYDFGGNPPQWGSVLLADRIVALIGARIATYGAAYAFKVRCGSCRERFEWEIDLANDLPVQTFPAASIEAFKNGNRLPVTIGGATVVLRFLTGADELKVAKIDRNAALSAALGLRIVEVEGVHPNDRLKWIDNLPLGQARDILAALDEHDGGVETAFDVDCSLCGARQEVEIPFGQGFLAPLPSRR